MTAIPTPNYCDSGCGRLAESRGGRGRQTCARGTANSFPRCVISQEATLLERFTPSPDGSRLDYEIVLTDPVMLTSPVTQNNSYACEVEQEIN